jgi:thiopurine S-methyltransferase
MSGRMADVMNGDWLERWQEGRTGWHERGGNKNLQRHWRASGKRVLVPLCGKSSDLIWLEQQGNEVVGVELSEIAVTAFFEENGLDYDVVDGELTAYVARDRSITIHCGDYFRFARGPFDGYYDRGALVAIAPDERARYVRHTRKMLVEDAACLVVSVEYEQSTANGPPFSIPGALMRDLWPELTRVAAYNDMENCPPKFRDAGLKEIIEAIWQSM